jgi:hypothetical protein
MYHITSSVVVEIKPWICSVCTYENTQHYYLCKMCGTDSDEFHIVNKAEGYKKVNKVNRVRRVFGKINNIILPVLSCFTEEQFKTNIIKLNKYVVNDKISGIWLMTTNTDIDTIKKIILWTRENYSNFWIGVNLLGESIIKVLKFIKENNPDGIWIDNSHVSGGIIQNIPNLFIDQLKRMKWNGLYFGGVLFKYIPEIGNRDEIVQNAIEFMDVLTTTGEGTGIAIAQEKLNQVYEITKKKICIGVASGISDENIASIKNKCNIFIVRTSIVDKSNNIILKKLNKLIKSLEL